MKYLILIAVFSLMTACGGGGGGGGGGEVSPPDGDIKIGLPPEIPPGTPNPFELDLYDILVVNNNSTIYNQESTKILEDSFNVSVDIFNSNYALPKSNIYITLEDCGVTNAFYDSNTKEIIMCWELFEAATDWGRETWTNEDIGIEHGVRAYLYILSHEMGHAFVDQYDIPILGNPEDVADSIGAILLLKGDVDREATMIVVDGAEFLLNFGSSYAAIHPVSSARYYDLMCLAWGAYPELANEPDMVITDAIDVLASTGRDCMYEYITKKDVVLDYIGDYIK